jgi:superfamily II DNA/RNA helicase
VEHRKGGDETELWRQIAAQFGVSDPDSEDEKFFRKKAEKQRKGGKRKKKKRKSNKYQVNDRVEAYIADEKDWFPGVIVFNGGRYLEIKFDGYDTDDNETLRLDEVRPLKETTRDDRGRGRDDEPVHQESERQKAVATPVVETTQDKGFQPGDQVTARYADDEGGEAWLPGTIEKIEGDFIFVSFTGYEEYESEKVRKEDVKAGVDESAVQNTIVEEEEAVEEEQEDPESNQPYPLRCRVIYKPGGDEEPFECFVKRYYERDHCYDIQMCKPPKDFLNGIPHEVLTYVPSRQEAAECVFIVSQKLKLSQYKFKDYLRSFGWFPFHHEKAILDRDGVVIFDKIISEDEDVEWNEAVYGPIPTKLPWYCPKEMPPILLNSRVKVLNWIENEYDDQDRLKTHKLGKIMSYDKETKMFGIKFRDFDEGSEEDREYMYAFEDIIVDAEPDDMVTKIFACAQKRSLSKRDFEGMCKTIFGRSLYGQKLENGLDHLIDVEETMIRWMPKNLPAKTEETYEFPPFYVRDTITFDGKPYGLKSTRCRGFVREIFEDGRHRIEHTPRKNEEDEEDPEPISLELQVHEMTLKRDRDQMVDIIFGAFQKMKISQEEFQLAMKIFFKDPLKRVEKFIESASNAEMEENTGLVCWDETEPLPAPDRDWIAPRIYREGAKIEFKNEQGFWTKGKVESIIDRNNGEYEISDKNDERHDMSACKMRPFRDFLDKIRACFAKSQKEVMKTEEINILLYELFEDQGMTKGFGAIADKLEEKGNSWIEEDQELIIQTLPPENLFEIWAKYGDVGFRQKIETIFKTIGENSIPFSDFNKSMKSIFDDEITSFEQVFDNETRYNVDVQNEIITYIGKVKHLNSVLDDAEEITWKERFEDEINWATGAHANRNTMLNIDDGKFRIKRNKEELQKFRDDAQIHYECDGEIPLPALSFEEAWKGLADQNQNPAASHAAGNILDALNREPQFEGPTPIQAACWPLINSCRDILGISKTGSGKTLAFGLPVLLRCYAQKQQLSEDERQGTCTCLVMVHTRDLAKQHQQTLQKWGESMGLRVLAVYGGEGSFRTQLEAVRQGVDVIVATTGRLLHFLSEESLTLRNTTMIVLDEADKLLQDEENVREVLIGQVRPEEERQCLLFSATYSQEVMDLDNSFFTKDPIKITVGDKTVKADDKVQQLFALLDAREHMDAALIATLKHITQTEGGKALVFFNAISLLENLHYTLHEHNIKHTIIHGKLPQMERESNTKRFERGEESILLATDIASRGLDIADITVVQFHFPRSGGDTLDMTKECYIHRLGRAGRADAVGKCYTLCTEVPELPILDILEDVGQFAPPIFYEREGRDVPEEAQGIPEFPEWAGGNNAFDQAIIDINWGYTTIDYEGSGNNFVPSVSHFYEQESEKIGAAMEEYGVIGKKVIEGLLKRETFFEVDIQEFAKGLGRQIDCFKFDENNEVEEPYFSALADNEENEQDPIRLFWCPQDHSSGCIKRDHFRAFFDKGDAEEEEIVHLVKHVAREVEHDDTDWSGQRVNVYWEEEKKTYPGTCLRDDGEWASVTLDEWPDEEEKVKHSCLSYLGDKILKKIDESGSKKGAKAQVEEDGEIHDCVVIDDFGNGSFQLQFADGTEDMYDEKDITFLASASSGDSKFNVGDHVEAFYEDEDETGWFDAKIVSVNPNGYTVSYVEFDDEEGEVKSEHVRAKGGDNPFIGKEVEAYFDDDDEKGWFSAKVHSKNSDGTYEVEFTEFDDDRVNLKLEHIRIKGAASGDVKDPWVGNDVQAYYEDGEEADWYPAKVLSKNEDGTYKVDFVEFEDGACDVKREHIKENAEAASVPAPVSSDPWVGKDVEAYFDDPDEGGWFPAKVTSKNGDGTYKVDFIEFDDDEADVKLEHIREVGAAPVSAPVEEPAAAPVSAPVEEPAAAPVSGVEDDLVGKDMEAYYEDDEEADWYPVKVLAKNVDGTYKVEFWEFEEDNIVNVTEDKLRSHVKNEKPEVMN